MASIGTSKPIKIIQAASTADADGFLKPSESVLFAGWAKVRQASGFREFQQGRAQIGTVKEFEIHYRQVIRPDANTRLEYGGRRYAISSIEPKDEKKFWWVIRATAIDAF